MKTHYFFFWLLFSPYIMAQNHIDEAKLKQHVQTLASDEFAGRKPGSDGDRLSVDYITGQFKAMGIKYELQPFEVVSGLELGKTNQLKANEKTFELNKDYRPLGFTSNQSLTAPLVFVGYGMSIKNDTIVWDDYSTNVKDKWVVIFKGTPKFYKNLFYDRDDLRQKVLIAADHGAKGVLLVGLGKEDDLTKLHFDKSKERTAIPVIHITRTTFEKITSTSSDSLNAMIHDTQKPVIKEFKLMINATADVQFIIKKTKNIVAFIEGKDKTTTNYIAFGAHYDHLGMGGEDSGSRMPDTSAVHNGADDNASGVGTIIELARYFKNNTPLHHMRFIAFGAEEMGLLGSKYYVEQMQKENSKALMMLNFDMLGRLDEDGITLGGVGTALELEKTDDMVSHPNFKISTSKDGFGPSDHASFYMSQVPVLFVTTGAHSDYHTPFDDADKINYTGYGQVAEWSKDLSVRIDSFNFPLNYQKTESAAPSRTGAKYKVTLGIIPDYAGSESNGLKIEGVRKGGAAERAGILQGDIIKAMNGKPVSNIYDYMYRLAELREGDTATVDVLRGEKHVIILVQL